MSKFKDPRYKAARRRVQELKAFYAHLSVYLSVLVALALLDVFSGGGLDWVIYPALGWGVAILIHGSQVLVIERFFGREWEERKIRELLGEKPKRGARLRWEEAAEAEEEVALQDLVRAANTRPRRSAGQDGRSR